MENVKTREPQQKRSIEKKNRIIETGFRLMCENGYQKTTTADIAKAAGVSTGIIYSYFKDKRDIFIYGLEAYAKHMLLPIYDRITPDLDVYSALNAIIDSLIEGHKVFQHAHKEIEALTMTDEVIAGIMFETELQITKQLELLLAQAGFDATDLPEKTHIMYNLVESLCHELTFHQHEGLNDAKMRQIVTDTIIFLLGKPVIS
ncbi:MAG: TetR/AcrR family transcriptional regulator [Lachnospiraceae bacterium]|nr:TetR/AcrR family transcriptional regulator [Lachnospiraceae bacterium]